MENRWVRPELIALCRGRAEESVLTGCKSGIALGPNDAFGPCNESVPMAGCMACSAPGVS